MPKSDSRSSIAGQSDGGVVVFDPHPAASSEPTAAIPMPRHIDAAFI